MLHAAGLTAPHHWADGRARIVPRVRERFVLWRVEIDDVPCAVVKHARREETLPLLAREARSLGLLEGRDIAPRAHSFDAARAVLVMSFAEGMMFDGTEPVPGREICRQLTRLHAVPLPTDAPSSLPWFEDPHAFDRDLARVYASVRAPLRRNLEITRRLWRPTSWIHGDLKWQNALHASDGRVTLVDWELAGRGDPLWDLAGHVQDKLLLAHGPARSSGVLSDALAAYTSHPPSAMHRPPAEAMNVLRFYVMARLLQTAAEFVHAHTENQVGRVVTCLNHLLGGGQDA